MFQLAGKPCDIMDYFVRKAYNGLENYLEFEMSVNDPLFSDCVENAEIIDSSNKYLIIKIDGNNGKSVRVSASLDLRDWRNTTLENFDNTSQTLLGTINSVLPDGWSFVNTANSTKFRTVRVQYGVPIDVLIKCASLYNVVFQIDNINKVVEAIDPTTNELSAAFVTEELNLRSLQYYGDSSNLITRLEARGKDGMTFASINDGKSYIENHSFTDDVIYGWWVDERYTDPQSLLENARLKLDALATPQRSYECDVVDLKSIYEKSLFIPLGDDGLITYDGHVFYVRGNALSDYSNQDLSLYQVVALKDIRRNRSVAYQVVDVKTYPHYPTKNVITLSNAVPSLNSSIDGLETEIELVAETVTEKIGDIEDSMITEENVGEIVEDLMGDAVNNATEWLTQGTDGNVFIRRNENGDPYELLILDTDSLATAQNVWRFNSGGLGHSSTGYNGVYTTAITADGQIVCDLLTTGAFTIAKNGKTVFQADASGKTVTVNTDYFTLDETGKITATQAEIEGEITVGGNEDAYGAIYVKDNNGNTVATLNSDGLEVTAGSVGGWEIEENVLKSKNEVITLNSLDGTIAMGTLFIRAKDSTVEFVTDEDIAFISPNNGAHLIFQPRNEQVVCQIMNCSEIFVSEFEESRKHLGFLSNTLEVTFLDSDYAEGTISFENNFEYAPVLTITPQHDSLAEISVKIKTINAGSATYSVKLGTKSSIGVILNWIAVGTPKMQSVG